jgi:excisionase family DNA binding protein
MPSHTPPVQPEDKSALRLNDAATVSGLSRSSLYNLIAAGKLRDCRIGNRRLILRSDLEAFIHSGVKPAA